MTISMLCRCRGEAVASSAGIIIGYARKFEHGQPTIPKLHLSESTIKQEIARLQQAVKISAAELDLERNHLRKLGSEEPLLVLNAHRMMIDDPELIVQTTQRIIKQSINAEWALRQQMDAIKTVFTQSENAYLRSRENDVEQIGQRILSQLLGKPIEFLPTSHAMDTPIIYVCEDFSISDIVRIWRQGIAGIITEQGGADAHNIIVARGIGLPALVGATGILKEIENGSTLVLDGEKCHWISNPSSTEKTHYTQQCKTLSVNRQGLANYASQASCSMDGREMKLMANIEFIEELDTIDEIGIDGIGLYRSEFLFLNRSEPPDEAFQFDYYCRLLDRLDGKPLTIRLLDIGGDKAWLYQLITENRFSGANPALGLRGIRLLLHWPALLHTQLRALIRAGEKGPLHILIPMVSNCDEVIQLRAIAEKIRAELGFHTPLSIGSMIEVPAAALIADALAEVSDFFSIGTNDLIQYTLAADRSDEEVAKLYQPNHPAIIQLIQLTAIAAKKAAIPLSVCGELAANPEWTATFLNLNMYALSMSLQHILPIRRTLSQQSYQPLINDQ
ncbi:MAG: phosphoenolpyruvate--protein phosphotransferase [Mariprofundus sp.]|nr:phosphoenolpyruvate--protein phosphotransferase [Mariprofundus sp.]